MLSDLQRKVFASIAANRNLGIFIAGSTPLNAEAARQSFDIDIFNDQSESMMAAFQSDCRSLRAAGLQVHVDRSTLSFASATISDGTERTAIDWAVDSGYRFLPAINDPLFGYRLHQADLVTNKMLATVGRREARDVLDLIYIHEEIVPLGAVVWACVDKDPGWNPTSIIAEARRSGGRYQQAEIDLASGRNMRIDAGEVSRKLRSYLEDAEAFIDRVPTHIRPGCLFLSSDQIGQLRMVQPTIESIDSTRRHYGSTYGTWPLNWPSSPEIDSLLIRAAPTSYST